MTSYLYPYIQESAVLENRLNDYILTIQYSLDGLSFVIFDKKEQKFLCLKHYTTSKKEITLSDILTELQEKESWKLKDFHKVNFIIDNKHSTFVPKEFYDEKLSKQYLDTLQVPSSNVKVDNVKSDIYNIYSVDDDIAATINIFSKDACIQHTSTILINSLIKEFSERNAETRVFVNVKNNYYELTIINKDRLIFHNYFNFNTKEDFLYFLLFTFEQTKVDNETVPLYFMGFIENNSSIINLCSRYIRNIRFINRDNNLKFVNELDTIPYYYYYTLYNSVSCE